MKGKLVPIGIALAVVLTLSAGLSAAQGPAPQGPAGPQVAVSNAFTYQGELQKDGSPVNATCAMTFTLYDNATAGSPVGAPVNTNVAVGDGLFTVALDFGADIFTGQARWLEVAVLCPGDSNPSTLDPRQALTAAPYALSLQPGAVISGTVLGAPLGSGVVLMVRNTASATSSHGLLGRADSPDGNGVRGYAAATSGDNAGVYGRSNSPDGYGVHGHNWAASGTAYGVYGESDSTDGSGVYGYANYGVVGRSDSTGGRGVIGLSTATSGYTYGIYGGASSTAGRGVYGHALATSGFNYGVFGESASPDGTGVRGSATATSGSNDGVYGRSASPDGTGVRGYAAATAGSGCGLYGRSDSPDGHGVYGWAYATSGNAYGLYGRSDSPDGHGVYGWAYATSGNAYGVYGRSSSIDGCGIIGSADATVGETFGVRGVSYSGAGKGVYGHAAATVGTTYGIYGQSDADHGIAVAGYASASTGLTYGLFARSNSTEGCAVYGLADATTGLTRGVFGYSNSPDGYGVYYIGGIGGIGLKTSIVETRDHGWRHLYSMESPAVLFEDVGSAQLVDGQAVVPLDPVFAQTVNLEQPYQVFLTAQGEEFVLLLVAAKGPTSFTVRGATLDGRPATCAFDYRIVARRLGYENVRAAPAADPTGVEQVMQSAATTQEQP